MRMEYILNPVQANFGVGVSSFGAGKVPSRSGVRGPGASMRCSGPDDEWEKRPTVCRDAFDCRDQRLLDSSASTTPQIVLTY